MCPLDSRSAILLSGGHDGPVSSKGFEDKNRADECIVRSRIDVQIHFLQLAVCINVVLCLRKNGKVHSSSVVPLTVNELPRPGYLCALDAEFVALNEDEIELHSDGTRALLRPKQFTLARVSVVRGSEPLEGVPFVDDYIITTDSVIDYLTEFSGIKPGDLDPAKSSYPLTTLKNAYRKLRALVDGGCIFIGHGLKKDFRIISTAPSYDYNRNISHSL